MHHHKSNKPRVTSLIFEHCKSSKTYIFRKKENERQFKLNRLLLTLAFFHFVTTLMGNISYLFNTVYLDAWKNFEGRSTFVTIGNVLNTTNCAKNFYLYCLVNEEIRQITVSKLSILKNKLKLWWNTKTTLIINP